MSNQPKKDGTLFSAAKTSEASVESRLVYALQKLQKPTVSNLAEALGVSRTTIISRIKILNEPYPNGFSMCITGTKESRDGYKIDDFGIFTKKKVLP